ncbi:MAG: hypothetical protein Kow00105_09460 [Phycisphaeraceae bacterium]
MVQAISQRAGELACGQEQRLGRLALVQILGQSKTEPEYRLLSEDLLDSVVVTEISESGTVPELRITNNLDIRVLLIDGQELIGAKQNRVLNTDVLVPAKTSLKLPVSCVEQGRWSYRAPRRQPGAGPKRDISPHMFQPGKSAVFRTRQRKSRAVYHALKEMGAYDADQSAVWSEVAEELSSSGVPSATYSLHDLYLARQRELDEFRKNLKLEDEAVGLAVFMEGRFQGLDIFDRHSTLAYYWEPLVDSYTISLLNREDLTTNKPAEENKADFPHNEREVLSGILDEAASAEWEGFQPPGEGRDYRLSKDTLAGSCLVFDERIVLHEQLFHVEPDDHNEERIRQAYRGRLYRRFRSRRHREQD